MKHVRRHLRWRPLSEGTLLLTENIWSRRLSPCYGLAAYMPNCAPLSIGAVGSADICFDHPYVN